MPIPIYEQQKLYWLVAMAKRNANATGLSTNSRNYIGLQPMNYTDRRHLHLRIVEIILACSLSSGNRKYHDLRIVEIILACSLLDNILSTADIYEQQKLYWLVAFKNETIQQKKSTNSRNYIGLQPSHLLLYQWKSTNSRNYIGLQPLRLCAPAPKHLRIVEIILACSPERFGAMAH